MTTSEKKRQELYNFIKEIILTNKNVNDRIVKLNNRGLKVKRCYVPTYNGIGNVSYLPRLNETRVIIGRPKNHSPREVFAVII